MKINTEPFKPENTICFFGNEINIFDLRDVLWKIENKKFDKSIDRFKKAFGKQLKTWIGGSERRRFYIWTFRLNDSVLYALVHNVKGIVFEYPENTDKRYLVDICEEIYYRLHLPNPL